MKVSERLESRLAKVPKVTPEDIGNWLAEAETESELTEELNANAVFYLALSFAYESIAADAGAIFLIQMAKNRLINQRSLQTIRSYQRTRLKSTGNIDGEKVLTKHLLNGQMGDDYMSDSQQEMDAALDTISEEFKEEHENKFLIL